MKNLVLGTARELKENWYYSKLVGEFDQHTADCLIKGELEKAGCSLSEFRTYLKVKKVFQNGLIDIRKVEANAKAYAQNAICYELGKNHG
jgi:hypothetical protein